MHTEHATILRKDTVYFLLLLAPKKQIHFSVDWIKSKPIFDVNCYKMGARQITWFSTELHAYIMQLNMKMARC